ncbi:hypothetical protein J1614_004327 [Plenodomus biglobosus]|nr:hypothetical protein J1614_004327 [Plenodomus biglobosus]
MSHHGGNYYQQQGGHSNGSEYGGQQYGQQPPYGGDANAYYGQGQPQGGTLQHFGGPGYAQEPPQYQQYPSAAAHSSISDQTYGHQNQFGGASDMEGERGILGGMAGGAAGAFGGHALGGKVGHDKVGTVVGALAGAFAGHKAQDAASDWKDERHEKKEREKQQQQQSHQQPMKEGNHEQNSSRTEGDFGGNFTASSRDIRLDAHGDYNLHAQCRRPDGSWQSSTISLNQILENDEGSFRWSQGSSNSSTTYTVQPGDTLRAIASRFSHCSFENLASHNNIQNPDMIYPGQTLQIPGGGSRGSANFGASARNLRLVDGGQRLEGELERNGQWNLRSIILDERIENRNGCLEFV